MVSSGYFRGGDNGEVSETLGCPLMEDVIEEMFVCMIGNCVFDILQSTNTKEHFILSSHQVIS